MKSFVRWSVGTVVLPISLFSSTSNAQSGQPPIAFVQASNVPCKVGRPNVKPLEGVTWTGQCSDGLATGAGTAQWSENGKPTLRFDGTFTRGLLEGKGKMIGADGDRFEGEYKGGLRHGHGIYVSRVGERFEGEYSNNQRQAATPPLPPANPSNAKNSVAQTPTPSGPAPSPPPAATVAKGNGKIGEVVAAPSGALLRIDSCGGMPVVYGLPPKALDLRTSTPSGQYRDVNEIGGLSPIVKEALDLLARNCNLQPNNDPWIILFVNGLFPAGQVPAPRPNGIRDFDSRTFAFVQKLAGAWKVANGPADLAQQQAHDRSNQEAAQQRQAQAAVQKEMIVARRVAFLKEHDAVEPPRMSILMSNPFSLEGKTIAVPVIFNRMTGPTEGRFEVLTYSLQDHGGQVVVSDIPKGTFLQPGQAFLAAKVVGLTPGQAGQAGVPHLKFVGVKICSDSNASCP